MTRTSNLILLLLICLASSTACKKNAGNGSSNPAKPDVYVLGSSGDSLVYWRNGAPVLLVADSSNTSATSMFLSGNDVYVTGWTIGTTALSTLARYWKNGVSTILPDTTGSASAYGVYVSGNDVYVGGSIYYPNTSQIPYTTLAAPYPTEGNVAVWWKDGIPNPLPTAYYVGNYIGHGSRVYNGYVSGIFVSGNDVYVAGGSHQYQSTDASTWQFAQYWKNGQAVNLSKGLADSNSNGTFNIPTTTGIYVSGNDVYVIGVQTISFPGLTQEAIYWKNGVVTDLTPGAFKAIPNGIFVDGTDVYIAGYVVTSNGVRAVYWKNGVINYLSNNPSLAGGICVVGTDVYVAGTDSAGGTDYATWWKNGVATHLGTGGTAIAIAVH